MFGGSGRHVHSGRWHGHRSYRHGIEVRRQAQGQTPRSPGHGVGQRSPRLWIPQTDAAVSAGRGDAVVGQDDRDRRRSTCRGATSPDDSHAAFVRPSDHHDPLRESRRDQRDDG
jgi:hypothetical protein